MLKVVRNLALGVALITLGVAVWRDYGTLIALKRAALAYLVTFFLSGVVLTAGTIGLRAYQPPPPPPKEPRKKPKRRKKKTKHDDAPDTDTEALEAPTTAPEETPETMEASP